MSAIVGIIGETLPNIDEQGEQMMKTLETFHADRAAVWRHHSVFLGCREQWVTPESCTERLPFFDERSGLVITADAIIDNRPELFGALGIPKDKRKGIGDSELILRSYQKWGQETPKHLIGDFAFMIWDEKRRALFGARDFSGNRTLYYVHDQKRFAFSTTLEPLLTLPSVNRGINTDWLAEFLAIPEMIDSVNTKLTVYRDIQQLPPAFSIVLKKGQVKLSCYCQLDEERQLELQSGEAYIEAFQEVFQRAVSDRLRSRRGIGAYLSGGLDSSAVVGFASRALGRAGLHTYSYIPEKGFVDWTPEHLTADESPYIESIVQGLGNVTEHLLDFRGKSPFTEIDDWLGIMEMPYKFFENSFWVKGVYECAQKEDIGVLLNGARGNFTISWGPALDYYARLLKSGRWIKLYSELGAYSRRMGAGRKRVLSAVAGIAFPMLKHAFRPQEEEPFPILINSDFADRTEVYDRLREEDYHGFERVKKTRFAVRRDHFRQNYSWNTPGTSNTKLSLHYGIKDRDPTNDLRVIRFCLSIPAEQVVNHGMDRALIRRSLRSLIPDRVRLNQRVRGVQAADIIYRMAPDWHLWLSELQKLTCDSLVSGLFHRQTLNDGIEKMKAGPEAELAYDLHFRMLMRALIVYRFLKKVC
ncbi:asparagine synthetase B [Sporolactobacillus sp. THM7-4]|nr:asparagine synthetase B [Sporolactobacillus sp. THM7-4]